MIEVKAWSDWLVHGAQLWVSSLGLLLTWSQLLHHLCLLCLYPPFISYSCIPLTTLFLSHPLFPKTSSTYPSVSCILTSGSQAPRLPGFWKGPVNTRPPRVAQNSMETGTYFSGADSLADTFRLEVVIVPLAASIDKWGAGFFCSSLPPSAQRRRCRGQEPLAKCTHLQGD